MVQQEEAIREQVTESMAQAATADAKKDALSARTSGAITTTQTTRRDPLEHGLRKLDGQRPWADGSSVIGVSGPNEPINEDRDDPAAACTARRRSS